MIEIIGIFLGVGAVPCMLLGVIMLISFLTCDYIEKFVVKAFCSFKNRRRQRYRGKINGGKVQSNPEPCSKKQKFMPSAPQYQQQEYQSPNSQNQRTEPFDSIEEIDRHFHEEKYRLAAASGTSTRKKSRKFNFNLTTSTLPPPFTTDNTESNLSSHDVSSSASSSFPRQQEPSRHDNSRTSNSTNVAPQSRFEDLPPPYSECFKQPTQEPPITKTAISIKKLSTSKEKSD